MGRELTAGVANVAFEGFGQLVAGLDVPGMELAADAGPFGPDRAGPAGDRGHM